MRRSARHGSMHSEVAAARLENQSITTPQSGDSAGLVAWFGAVQAQDYPASKWALGLRLPVGGTENDVAAALDCGQIVRTHVLRPTWHLVDRDDVGWMLELTSDRVHRRLAPTHRSFQLDSAICVRAARTMERVLRDGQCLTRAELGDHLKQAGLPSRGTALALLTVFAELERVMCSGPFRGKDLTYALFASRVPAGRKLAGDEAIAELTRRYLRSHGPATMRDFVWWSSLTARDAKRGLEMNQAQRRVIDDVTYWTIGDTPAATRSRQTVHLLPIYDEYFVAYHDRVAVPLGRARRGTARFDPVLLTDGQVAGTWKAVRRAGAPNEIDVRIVPGRRLTRDECRAVEDVVNRYGRFLGVPATLSMSSTRERRTEK